MVVTYTTVQPFTEKLLPKLLANVLASLCVRLKRGQGVNDSKAERIVGGAKEAGISSIDDIEFTIVAVLVVADVPDSVPALLADELLARAIALKHFQLRLVANTTGKLVILGKLQIIPRLYDLKRLSLIAKHAYKNNL